MWRLQECRVSVFRVLMRHDRRDEEMYHSAFQLHTKRNCEKIFLKFENIILSGHTIIFHIPTFLCTLKNDSFQIRARSVLPHNMRELFRLFVPVKRARLAHSIGINLILVTRWLFIFKLPPLIFPLELLQEHITI